MVTSGELGRRWVGVQWCRIRKDFKLYLKCLHVLIRKVNFITHVIKFKKKKDSMILKSSERPVLVDGSSWMDINKET